MTYKLKAGLLGGTAMIAGLLALAHFNAAPADAADHLDPGPRVSLGDSADIGDLYAWHNDAGNLVVILTYAGPQAAGTDAVYDREVLYGIHIDDSDDDLSPDRDLWFRFGQNAAGEWGVLAQNIPGGGPAITGNVQSQIEAGQAKVFAGQMDDPFFFDGEGFAETLATGDLAFNPARDAFAGQNINVIVAEFPIAEISDEAGPYNIWATTAR